MKIVFALMTMITSIAGSYLLLTAPTPSHLMLGVIFILSAIVCLLFLVIRDYRQELDFWKSMKTFMIVAVMLSLGSCVSIRPTCPSTDTQYFYKQAGVKPYYHRR
jgi:hypothetical protein